MAREKERQEGNAQVSQSNASKQGAQGRQSGDSQSMERQSQGTQRQGPSSTSIRPPTAVLASRDVGPFSMMQRLSQEMDRMFDEFWRGGFGSLMQPSSTGSIMRGTWSPQVEVFRRGNQLIIQADLPGMNKDNIEVEIEEGDLVLRGERGQEDEENREGYYRSERSYGSFYRRIPLPEGVDAEQAQASFKDGVLEITMQVPEQVSSNRKIQINS